MGFVLLFAGGLAFLAGCFLGGIGIALHVYARKKGRGSWVLFALISISVGSALAIHGVSWFPTQHAETTPDSYDALLKATLFIAVAPGLGPAVASLAALWPNKNSRN